MSFKKIIQPFTLSAVSKKEVNSLSITRQQIFMEKMELEEKINAKMDDLSRMWNEKRQMEIKMHQIDDLINQTIGIKK